MPKAKDEKKVNLILNATLKLVIKTGFYGLKMADVAREAQLATGTIYIYFKNKEELINATFLHTKKEIADLLSDPSSNSDIFYDTFKNKWYAYFNFCLDHPHKMLFVEQFIYSGFILEEIKLQAEQKFKDFDQLLEGAQEQSIIKKSPIYLIKAQLMGPIHEVIKVIHNQYISPSSEAVDECFNMAWSSVRQ